MFVCLYDHKSGTPWMRNSGEPRIGCNTLRDRLQYVKPQTKLGSQDCYHTINKLTSSYSTV